MTYPSGISIYSPKLRDSAVVRKQISQNGNGYISVEIWDGQNAVDPDTGTISLQVWFSDATVDVPTTDDPRGILILEADSGEITKDSTGFYHYDIGPQYTAGLGVFTVRWTYEVNGTAFVYNDFFETTSPMPFYESLSEREKSVVQHVTWMMGDLFDSTEGGPHLVEEFQTHWNYERIAHLMELAAIWINYTGFPIGGWGVGPGSTPVPPNLNGLLVLGTYYEVIRHLIRSYVEIPDFPGVQITYTNRRDYMDRWQSVLREEWQDYKTMIVMSKRPMLGLGRSAMLLSGGIFGGAGRLFISGMFGSETRAWRFYPAIPAIQFGAAAPLRAGNPWGA